MRVREIDRGKVSLELVDALDGATLPGDSLGQGGGNSRRDDRGGRDGRDRGGRDGRDGRDRGRSRDQGRQSTEDRSDSKASSGQRRQAPKSFEDTFEEMNQN